MQWEIRFERKAQKDLAKIPLGFQAKILACLPLIEQDPFIGKKLDGKLEGLYSWRVWPYRILYKIYRHKILIVIVSVGHRQGVYK